MITTSYVAVFNNEKELCGMGFKGKSLRDLMTLVTTQEDSEELERFIINYEGKYKSSVSLASGFRRYKMLQSPMEKLRFIYGYEGCISIDSKIYYLQTLLKCYIDVEDVSRLDTGLSSGKFKLESFYDAFIGEPLLPVKRLCIEAELQSCKLNIIPEPTNW